MWKCETYGEEHSDKFEVCWKCAGEALARDEAALAPPEPPPTGRLKCVRCTAILKYAGAKKLDGRAANLLDITGGLFFWNENFDVYFCPQCGHVEFFLQGIGDDGK